MKYSTLISINLSVNNPEISYTLMMVHAFYGWFFDHSIYEIDTKVSIRIDSVNLIGNLSELVNNAYVTIPSGKISVFDLSPENKKSNLNSGYLAFPLQGKDVVEFPTNIVVTIVEGNDFGDVIGKSAKLVGENKDSIIDKLKDLF